MKKLFAIILTLLMAVSLITPAFAESAEVEFNPEWLVEVSSDIGGTKMKLFDGNPATFWHTHYTVVNGSLSDWDKAPHYITINFISPITLSGITYVPRSDSYSGTIKNMGIYASTDGETFEKIAEYKLTGDAQRFDTQVISWGDMEMSAMKIEITNSYGGYAAPAAPAYGSYSAPAAPASDFAMLADDDSSLPF